MSTIREHLIEEGRQEGWKIGYQEGRLIVAAKMLSSGMKLELIQRYTRLSKMELASILWKGCRVYTKSCSK